VPKPRVTTASTQITKQEAGAITSRVSVIDQVDSLGELFAPNYSNRIDGSEQAFQICAHKVDEGHKRK